MVLFKWCWLAMIERGNANFFNLLETEEQEGLIDAAFIYGWNIAGFLTPECRHAIESNSEASLNKDCRERFLS